MPKEATFILDTEFNGFGGELISIALVSVEDCDVYFYEVLHCDDPTPWVQKNVLPVLLKESTSLARVRCALQKFLSDYSKITIVADWPEDIAHFCKLLTFGEGRIISLPSAPIVFELLPFSFCKTESAMWHNALSDALTLRSDYIKYLDALTI